MLRRKSSRVASRRVVSSRTDKRKVEKSKKSKEKSEKVLNAILGILAKRTTNSEWQYAHSKCEAKIRSDSDSAPPSNASRLYMLYAAQNSAENEKLSFLYALKTAALTLRHQTYEEAPLPTYIITHKHVRMRVCVCVCMRRVLLKYTQLCM